MLSRMRIQTVRSGKKLSYLFGADGSGPLVAVDPGTEVDALCAAARGRPIEAIICTSGFGHVPSLKEVQERTAAPVFAHRSLCFHLADAGILDLAPLSGGMRLAVDTVPYRVLACPGVDPFAIALLLANSYLFAGETLLPGERGRLDGPGADARSLFVSTRMLMQLPEGITLLGGRDVGFGDRSTLKAERARNPSLTAKSLEAFLANSVEEATGADHPDPGSPESPDGPDLPDESDDA